MTITRRGVRVTLGALWILDGLLQLQPAMFTPDFANRVIAPAGEGQPWFVSAPIGLTVKIVAAQPLAIDLAFAVVQLALGACLLLPRLARPAIVASLLWSAGVWWLGEGLGGLAGGHADLLTGAPGAVVLYAVLAVAAWPPDSESTHGSTSLPRWLAVAWAIFWIGGAVLRVLPGQGSSATIAAELTAGLDDAPDWLGHLQSSAAAAVLGWGTGLVLAWVVVCVAVGLGGLRPGRLRAAAAAVGIACALLFWVLGQSLGEPWTGVATDPNTGPMIILMALGLVSVGLPAHAGRRQLASRPGRNGVTRSDARADTVPTHAAGVGTSHREPAVSRPRVVYYPQLGAPAELLADPSGSELVDTAAGRTPAATSR
jgi:hypothetical protein